MKNICLSIITVVLSFNTAFCQELVSITIFNNKVVILIPKNFTHMSEEMMRIKYPSENRPTLIFTNERGSINVAFNHTQSEANQQNLEEYKEVFENSFKNMYPSAEWIDTGIKKINGKYVGYQEIITPALDTKIYNLMFYTDLDGRLLLCTFNCMIKDKNNWQKTAHEIMNSLIIADGE